MHAENIIFSFYFSVKSVFLTYFASEETQALGDEESKRASVCQMGTHLGFSLTTACEIVRLYLPIAALFILMLTSLN